MPQLGKRYEKCMASLQAYVSAISSFPSVLFPCLWQVAVVGNQGPEQPPGNLSLSQSNTKGQRATELGKMIMPSQMNIACWSVITQPENSPDFMKKERDSRGDWARRSSWMMATAIAWKEMPHHVCPVVWFFHACDLTGIMTFVVYVPLSISGFQRSITRHTDG